MSSVYIKFSDCLDEDQLDVSKKVAATPKAINKLLNLMKKEQYYVQCVPEIPEQMEANRIYFTVSESESSD